MSSNRRPRLTPRGETYLAARDLAITMARADTPTSRAWLEGFLDGMRAHDAEQRAERASADRLDDLARGEAHAAKERAAMVERMARGAAEEAGEE
jgi:hypothetical protein